MTAQSLPRDDNVFCPPSQSDPASVLGTPSKAGTYSTTSAGLKWRAGEWSDRLRKATFPSTCRR
jgi:hypothetical protein